MEGQEGEGKAGVVEEVTLANITEEKLNQMAAELAESDEESEVEEEEIESEDEDVEEPEPQDTEPEPEPEPEKPKADVKKGDSKPAEEPAVDVKVLEEKIKKLERANESYGRLYGSWSNEIGEMRKALKGRLNSEESRQALNEKFADDPAGAVDEVLTRRELEISTKESERRAARDLNEADLRSRVPDIDDLMPQVVEIVKERGLPPNVVSQFTSDPFMFNGTEILSLVHEAKLKKMESRISDLLGENEKLKTGKDTVHDKLKKASKKRRVVTANDAGNSESSEGKDPLEGLTEERIDHMSDEEVEALRKKVGLPRTV